MGSLRTSRYVRPLVESQDFERMAGVLQIRSTTARFGKEVDLDGVLDPAERTKRAEHANKAYYMSVSYTHLTLPTICSV